MRRPVFAFPRLADRLASVVPSSAMSAYLSVETLPMPVLRLDASGAGIEANLAWHRLTGSAARDAVTGAGWMEAFSLASRIELTDMLAGHTPVGTRSQPTELSLGLAADSLSLLRAQLSRLDDGEWLLVVVSGSEEPSVAERLRSALLAAEQVARSRSDFLAHMSHEIRTPLNAILGMADLLGETALDAHQRKLTDVLRTAGDHLLEIINDVLDLSKIEAGRLRIAQVEFNLRDVLEKTLEILSPRSRQRGLELACHIAPDASVHRVGDPQRLRQVLMNLVGNAIKFTERGEVVLHVEVDRSAGAGAGTDEWLRFSVRDTGMGIPPEQQALIFEAFSQVDESITRRFGGTGLGLSISRRLVELMGGPLNVESTIGVGSTFWFRIPLSLQNRPAQKASSSFLSLQGMPVLVVAENETQRVILREMISGWGGVVHEASSVTAAMHALEQAGAPFQILVLDEDRLAADDTRALTQRFAVGRSGPAPIILISIDATDDHGAAPPLYLSHLQKPVRRRELMEAITAAMQLSDDATAATTTTGRIVDPRPLRVLVVDDTEENRLVILHYVSDCGYQCEYAIDGEDAVKRFTAAPFDVVLMDIQMPLLDGYAATRELRAIENAERRPPATIIALTAHAMTEDIARSLSAGCTTHLNKPIRRDALVSAIIQHAADPGAAPGRRRPNAPADRELHLDEELFELIPAFLRGRRKDSVALLAAVADSDFATVSAIGHTMRGLGSTYGFDYVSALGGAFENAAARTDADAILQLTSDLDAFVARIELKISPKGSGQST